MSLSLSVCGVSLYVYVSKLTMEKDISLSAPPGIAPNRNPAGPNFFSYNLFSTDVNGDGWPDVLLSVVGFDLTNGALQLMLNNGDGTFLDATGNIAFDTPWQVKDGSEGGYVLRLFLEDFNGDTWPDILALGSGFKNKLLMNNGAGMFTEATSVLGPLTDDGVNLLEVGDIDGDTDIDIIAPAMCDRVEFCPGLQILRNNTILTGLENSPEGITQYDNGVLTIPVLKVGDTYYRLELNLSNEQPIEFQVMGFQEFTISSELSVSTFSNSILAIPVAEIADTKYRLELQLLEGEPTTLRLIDAEQL